MVNADGEFTRLYDDGAAKEHVKFVALAIVGGMVVERAVCLSNFPAAPNRDIAAVAEPELKVGWPKANLGEVITVELAKVQVFGHAVHGCTVSLGEQRGLVNRSGHHNPSSCEDWLEDYMKEDHRRRRATSRTDIAAA